jgi:hypothetical protein
MEGRMNQQKGNIGTVVREMGTGPHFKDYRTTTDGVMIADIGFKKQVWALDPELDVVWDWQASKWEIWKFPGQGRKLKKRIDHKAFHIMTIQTQKRNFRELGADILLKLQAGDPNRYSLKEFVAYFDQMDDNIQRAKQRAFKNRMDEAHAETFWYHRGLRKTVPQNFNVKPSEERLLLKVAQQAPGPNVQIFEQSNRAKIANAITGGAVDGYAS